jgi:L-iditol 2-dehydrogenase
MKAFVVNKDGSLEIREVPKPRYNDKQALVKIISCGICGTDATIIARKFKGVTQYPLILGHESIGEVVELGDKVTSYKLGDKIMVPYIDADPEVYGELGVGYGAFAEYAVANDVAAYEACGEEAPSYAAGQTVLPVDIDPVDGAMIVTFREVLSAIRYFKIKKDDSIVVFGCGPVGLTFIKFMSLLGVKNILAVARNVEKMNNALESGATKAFNSRECDIEAEIKKLFPNGVDYVLDAAGSNDVVNQGLNIIRDRGEILCYGVPKTEQYSIDFSNAPYNWKINFQQMPSKAEEAEAQDQVLEWIRTGKLVLKEYISDYYKFEDINAAFEKHLSHKMLKKGIIIF